MTIELERPTAREQTRARYPDEEGYVERDGVRLFYEVYGSGEPTVFLLPTWSIIHSRHWKMQIPYLARHCRVLTFDGRGNGRSDRPPEPDAYREEEFAADALAVMDATATERAVLVSLSRGAERSLLARREPPGAGRQAGVHRAGSAAAARPPRGRTRCRSSTSARDEHVGWGKWNRHYWLEHYDDFLEFFFSQCFTEPHSTKQREDAVGWGLETDAETLVATQLAPRLEDEESVRELLARDRLPGARHPRERRRRAALRLRRTARRAGGRRAHDPRGVGPSSPRPRPGQGQPAAARLHQAGAAAAQLGARQVAPQARPLHLLADRARPRAARRGDRGRAAQAASRPRDRLAGASTR